MVSTMLFFSDIIIYVISFPHEKYQAFAQTITNAPLALPQQGSRFAVGLCKIGLFS